MASEAFDGAGRESSKRRADVAGVGYAWFVEGGTNHDAGARTAESAAGWVRVSNLESPTELQ